MQDIRITVASLRSILRDPRENLARVDKACATARRNGARIILLPELMLTGHGGHARMTDNAEPVPTGSLGSAILEISWKYSLCVCVGIAELTNHAVFNSQMVADKGKYLGLQRKINLSGDEYCHFGAGESVEVFDIGDVRFGISICYDNLFPELALIHSLNSVDVILAPHAARTGKWPARLTRAFCSAVIRNQQAEWEKVHRARAYDHNVYVLLCNAVGSSTEGLKHVIANHAGTVMGVNPDGEVFLRTKKHDFSDEIVTVELKSAQRKKNHAPSRNRRMPSVINLFTKVAKTCTVLFMLLLGASGGGARAAEYFVALDGHDTHDGLKHRTAFATIQRGVNALKPGDTLTIAPGEYFGASSRERLGSPDVETVIRAAIPGTALIRGDVPLPTFHKMDGYRSVYEADFDSTVDIQAVNDPDKLAVYTCMPSIPGLDFCPGRFCHVPAAKKVYLSTGDFSPAEARRLTASMHKRSGIELTAAQRVRLEGLSVTGFRGEGILLQRSRRCVVSDCRTYLNSRGIRIDSMAVGGSPGGGNVIERCVAWANQGDGLGANVQSEDTIRDSLAFLNGATGMRLYAGVPHLSRMHDNLAWGNAGGDFFMKSGISRHVVERCTGPGSWPHESGGSHIRHCLVGVLQRGPRPGIDFLNNIHLNDVLTADSNLNLNVEFADPAHHDYRLQATSKFRGAGKDGGDLGAYPYRTNVFYVAPQGNDKADGLSVAASWATLKRAGRALRPGDTLYLLPGRYTDDLAVSGGNPAGERIHIRGHGTGTVELAGRVGMGTSHPVSFERLRFTERVEASGGGGLVFEQCVFAGDRGGLSVRGVDGLRVIHCHFSGGGETQVGFSGCSGVFLAGNRFDNTTGAAVSIDRPDAVLYSDYNAYRRPATAWRLSGQAVAFAGLPAGWERYGTAAESEARMALASGPHGRAVGTYRPDPGLWFRLAGPFVHAVGATSANIEWYASHRSRITLDWGTSPACTNGRVADMQRFGVESEPFGSFSLTNLAPATRYHVRLRSVEPLDTPRELIGAAWNAEPIAFSTAERDPDPVTYHVSPKGDDAADGLSPEKPLRSISRAAARVRPGDTVRVAGGVYHASTSAQPVCRDGRSPSPPNGANG